MEMILWDVPVNLPIRSRQRAKPARSRVAVFSRGIGRQGNASTPVPVGFNSSNNLLGISYVGGVENRSLSGNIAGTSETVTTTSGTYTFRLPYTSTADNMPPYLVVYMWRRTA